jgi:hypothetical protein
MIPGNAAKAITLKRRHRSDYGFRAGAGLLPIRHRHLDFQ